MDIPKLLHMNEGVGETSYAHNSSFQGKVLSMTESTKKAAIVKMYRSCFPTTTSLCIAELGCSSGPNAFSTILQLIAVVDGTRRELGHHQSQDFQVFLNDLPSNDFNTLFQSLPSIQKKLEIELGKEVGQCCFFNGVPGSFYSRLFTRQSLHFVHSSFSLHWLSKVPRNLGRSNKGEVWLWSSTPESVIRAYFHQFQADFSTFLKCRSEEVVAGGAMVFTLLGRENDAYDFNKKGNAASSLKFLSLALSQMVSEGLIEEEKLDKFNMPIYTPSPAEIRVEVEKEGSFTVDKLQVSETGWDEHAASNEEEPYIANTRAMRALAEPLLVVAFGGEVIDEIFKRYAKLLGDAMARDKYVHVNLTVSLTRLN